MSSYALSNVKLNKSVHDSRQFTITIADKKKHQKSNESPRDRRRQAKNRDKRSVCSSLGQRKGGDINYDSAEEDVITLEELQLQQLKLQEAQIKIKMNLLLNRDKKNNRKSNTSSILSISQNEAGRDLQRAVHRIDDVNNTRSYVESEPGGTCSCMNRKAWRDCSSEDTSGTRSTCVYCSSALSSPCTSLNKSGKSSKCVDYLERNYSTEILETNRDNKTDSIHVYMDDLMNEDDNKSQVSDINDKIVFSNVNKLTCEIDALMKNRDNHYEHIDDDFKIVIALPDYPKSKIQLYHMERFNDCLKNIIDMQMKARLLVKSPAFIDCYISKGAIVCVCKDIESKLWIVRVSSGIRERMKYDLLLMKIKTKRICVAQMKIPNSCWPASAVDTFKLIQYFNPNLNTESWQIYDKNFNNNVEYTSFLIDKVSFEILRGSNFKNIIDYNNMEFEVLGYTDVYYERLSALEDNISSVASRIKLLCELRSSDSMSTICWRDSNISTSEEYMSNLESRSTYESSVVLIKKIKNKCKTIVTNKDIKEIDLDGKIINSDSLAECNVGTVLSQCVDISQEMHKNISKSDNMETKNISSQGELTFKSNVESSNTNKKTDSISNVLLKSDAWTEFPQFTNLNKGEENVSNKIICEKETQACDKEELRSKSSLNRSNTDSNVTLNANRGFAYNRRTNYLHIENDLKVALVLEGYPKDKIEGTHIKLMKHIFKEHVQKDTKSQRIVIIPRFNDVYLSNGAMIHICDNIDTKKYLIELLPKLIKSTGLKLTIRDINELIRFTRVIMTLPEELSSLESREILPKIQQLYPGLNPDCWKCYSDVVGKLKRQFGVDSESLEVIKNPEFHPVYEGHNIIFRIIDRRKAYANVTQDSVTNEFTEEITDTCDTFKKQFETVNATGEEEITSNEVMIHNAKVETIYMKADVNTKKDKEYCNKISLDSCIASESIIPLKATESVEDFEESIVENKSKFTDELENKPEVKKATEYIKDPTLMEPIGTFEDIVNDSKLDDNIETLLQETILKYMYCVIEPNFETNTKIQIKHYDNIIPDDLKLYFAPINYPERRLDKEIFYSIKKTLENLVLGNWNTENAFVPQIYDIYLFDGVIFVICKDKKSRFWIEDMIHVVGDKLHLKLEATEYRGAVGIVNMVLKTEKSFEEVVSILQQQNPRLRTKYWRKIRTDKCSTDLDVIFQMDSLSAQVVTSRNFNGVIDNETAEFQLGHLQTIIKSRINLEESNNKLDKDTMLESVSNNNTLNCESYINEIDINDFNVLNNNYILNQSIGQRSHDTVNKTYYKSNESDLIEKTIKYDEDYCKVDLIIPTSILPSSKGSLLVILDLLNKKNPYLNTDQWKIEGSPNNNGEFCVLIDKRSASVIRSDDFNSTVGGEKIIFQF